MKCEFQGMLGCIAPDNGITPGRKFYVDEVPTGERESRGLDNRKEEAKAGYGAFMAFHLYI